MNPFTHLHVHTQYSILDGASNIPLLLTKAKEDGMVAVAITDHGNMFGVKEFYNEARKIGLKPIIGCEVYISVRGRQDRSGNEDRSSRHLIILAKNKKGYENLSKLVSRGYTEGFYYKPRIDFDLISQFHEGLIISSSCLGGEIPQAIANDGIEAAEKIVERYKNLLGPDFYLELQRHQTGVPETDRDVYDRQQKVNKVILQIAQKHGIKVIATNDVHFINSEDAEAHDRLICLNTNSDLDDPNRLHYTKQEYFKTTAEMRELYSDVPEVIDNTLEIAEKVELYELNRDPIMPDFPLPQGFTDENEYLSHLTYEGAAKRYGNLSDEIKDRIEFELSVVKKMGYPGYFLIVQDFLRAARELGVSVGPGRGSAAGSVVAYCIRITDIDPLKYKLLFERFLNPDRVSMPDIDIDFDEDGRDKVIKYVVEKYGYNHVAHIITFGTMAAKMAIRDVARIQKLPLSIADRIAKLVPERPGTTLTSAYEEVKELRDIKESGDDLVKQTLKYAETLEGSVRHTGLHACGIIIGHSDLTEYIPVCTNKDTPYLVAQFDGSHIESVGMLKMDFLGLKTLSIISDALENIRKSKGIHIDMENLPLDDRETYEVFARGETTGLFQFESAGMKRYLKDLKPNRFEDLIAMNALYRPGPMEYIPNFVNRKHGREKILYDFPIMEEYLNDTYGITVYQEQVMQLSQAMAGFSRGEADTLRKAMGKKNRKMMDDMKKKFIEGCSKNGMDITKVEKVWTDWEAFAQYAFNKSHSTCYALVAYQTAYLKAHYPGEFMAAVLSRNISDIKKITLFMDECKRMGMNVLGPDINESSLKFTVNKNGNIRFGLGAIKGMGEAAVNAVVEEREARGPFKNIFEFIERVNLAAVNKKSLEAMAMAGAFDTFTDIRREQYFAITNDKESTFIEAILRYGNKLQLEKNSKQHSLFGDNNDFGPTLPPLPDAMEWTMLEKLNKEKDLIGIYLSAHPLDQYRLEIKSFASCTLADLSNIHNFKDKDISIAGIVTGVHHGLTKTNKPYGWAVMEDYTDSFKIMLFGKDYLNFKNFFTIGYSLLIKGKVQERQFGNNPDELEFKIGAIHMLPEVKEELIKSISIKVPLDLIQEDFIAEIEHFSNRRAGKVELRFTVIDLTENIQLDMFSRKKRINLDDDFVDFLESKEEIEFRIN
jgi:DNA polymerase-3 subunit alpha